MALFFNGIEIPTNGDVIFGGSSFTRVIFNGVTYWEKGTGTIPPPPTPGFCEASDGDFTDKILVQWGYSHYNAYYEIRRDDTLIATVDGDTWYDDYSATGTHSYYVRACWIDGSGCSGSSESDTGYLDTGTGPGTPPDIAPVSLMASDDLHYNIIEVSWSDGSTTDADSTYLYRDNTLIDSLPYGTREYKDVVGPGEVHTYFARYYNDAGEGPDSNSDQGSTLAEQPYVLKAGDTMTGFLTLHSDPVNNLHAATKQYVDSIDITPPDLTDYVLKAGDTMTGSLTMSDDSDKMVFSDGGSINSSGDHLQIHSTNGYTWFNGIVDCVGVFIRDWSTDLPTASIGAIDNEVYVIDTNGNFNRVIRTKNIRPVGILSTTFSANAYSSIGAEDGLLYYSTVTKKNTIELANTDIDTTVLDNLQVSMRSTDNGDMPLIIEEDLYEAAPYLVNGNVGNGMNINVIIALLIAKIQELENKINV